MMPEKLATPIIWLTRRVGVLVAAIISTMLLVWFIDPSVLDFSRYPIESLLQKHDNFPNFSSLDAENVSQSSKIFVKPKNSTLIAVDDNAVLSRTENQDGSSVMPLQNVTEQASDVGLTRESFEGSLSPYSAEPDLKSSDGGVASLDWVSVELERNYSSSLLSRWSAPGGEPYKDSKSIEIKFVNFVDKSPIVLSTGDAHEVVFQAVDESGNNACFGGDYFEIVLTGESWRSRPPTRDLGNGTYSFTLQVHPDFAGAYNLTIILLFRHFEGLKFSTARFGYDKQLRKLPFTFSESEDKLPELQVCRKSDFNRDVWVGRWTRHGANGACEISNDGRYRCLKPDYPCTKPWCNGSLGLLESNGWVYSAHCSFRLLSDDAWTCLNNRWLFFWGDSNHVDTIRNILFFFLGVPFQELEVVARRFDKSFVNPKDPSQSLRITNIFNGHWNETKNYLGLDSLSDEVYRDLLKSFFNGSAVPDTVVLNSGLHDGIYWKNIRRFVAGAETAASFWKLIMEGVKKKGLEVSNFIFRSTIATGGYARTLAFNPSKMEAFNGILLEKLREAGLVTSVIDDFDMTWAWHFDNRCNDGVHYGRFPAKMKWRDGKIGHQYFVDLMLGQVLLNAICPI